MSDKLFSDKDFEQLMLAAVDAENAGVFDETPVNAAQLLATPEVTTPAAQADSRSRMHGWLRVTQVVTPLAACLAIWFGLNQTGLWSGQGETGSIPAAVPPVLVNGDAHCYDFTTFENCFTGPGSASADGDCSCADLDKDGDVDFADFGRFQRLVNSRDG